jgi:two-component system CheB/CheR fusion protein
LGASAGGLEPLQEFLEHVPAASGLVFVVIQHLEPNHPSMLAELLARHTTMPVLQASDGLPPEPDHVYVIAPGTLLTIDKGVFHVVAYEGPSSSLIDAFLHSLAEDQGEQAVGALFSGAGHDGTVGLRAIKEHGGLTLAQPPETATHDCMLQSAIGAGLVDHVVPVAQMPAIIASTRSTSRNSLVPTLRRASTSSSPPPRQDLRAHSSAHRARFQPLQRGNASCVAFGVGCRFTTWSRSMAICSFLENDSAEAEGLLKDLLIGVTQFFRDPEAFQALAQQIIPRIVQGKSADAPIRVWVPGCASGEEAYSIAILLREHLDRLETRRFAQIFATDLDAAMLAEARHGRYPADIADQVSPERLARFFVRDPSNGFRPGGRLPGGQRAARDVHLLRAQPHPRSALLAARSHFLPECSHLPERRAAEEAGAALPLRASPRRLPVPGAVRGHLRQPRAFRATDKRNRIFRRKETVTRPVVEFPLASRSAARASGASPTPQIERRVPTQHEKLAPRSNARSSRNTRRPRRSSTRAATCSLWPDHSAATCNYLRAP